MARAADVADRLALRHDLADRDGEARLVAVGGRDPAAVVDRDEVAVARHPARVDDAPRRGGVDRRAVADTDVDPFVHPPPAPAERARHRAVHRPDEAGCRGRRVAGRVAIRRLGRADLRGERGARLLQTGGLVQVLGLRLLDVLERVALGGAGSRELILVRQQPVAQRGDLVPANADRAHLGRSQRAETPRVLALDADALLRALDLAGDRAVLRADRLDHLRGIDQVGDALRPEQHFDRARLAVLVEVDQAVAEPLGQHLVLAAVEMEAAGLEAEELRQPVELLLVERQVALKRREFAGDVAGLPVERADLAVHGRDLSAERALAPLGPGELCLHALQARVDRLLAARDVAAGGRREDGREGYEQRNQSPEAHRTWVRRDGRRPCPPPATPAGAAGAGAGGGPGQGPRPGGR